MVAVHHQVGDLFALLLSGDRAEGSDQRASAARLVAYGVMQTERLVASLWYADNRA